MTPFRPPHFSEDCPICRDEMVNDDPDVGMAAAVVVLVWLVLIACLLGYAGVWWLSAFHVAGKGGF